MRLRTLPEGIIVYSVGREGIDDGGENKRQHLVGLINDIGYQLWNVDQRRQPPRNPWFPTCLDGRLSVYFCASNCRSTYCKIPPCW